MAQASVAFDHSSIKERPFCARCDISMWLARVQPSGPGYGKRTFECPVCHDETVVIVSGWCKG